MAIGKTIQIHDKKGLTKVDDYTREESKTTFSPEMQSAFRYDTNPFKTTIPGTNIRLVSGYKCNPDCMQDDFAGPREAYYATHDPLVLGAGKQEIFGIHYIMSFPQVEGLDPRLVHQIGLEFCDRMAAEGIGDFQCVVSTHMNTDHLHNHILINAFSVDGKHKFHDNMTTRHKMRQINDELCLKYGLPILEEKDKSRARSEKTSENKARMEGRSWKEQIRVDIDAVINTSSTYEEFEEQMRELGYSFRSRNDGSPISITDESGNRVRLEKLGTDYTYESIIRKIAEEQGISVKEIDHPKEKKEPEVYMSRISRYTDSGRRRSDLEILFLKVIAWLKLAVKAFKAKQKEPEAEEASRQCKNIEKALDLVQKYEIENVSSLNKLMKENGRKKRGEENDIELFTGYIEACKRKKKLDEEIKPAEIAPMTKWQRQNLYLLLKENDLRIKYKYDEVDAVEAQKIINYLQHKSDQRPDVLSGTYSGQYQDFEKELSSVISEKEKDLEEIKSEYKDFKYIQKNVTFCKTVEKDEKNGLSEEEIINKEKEEINEKGSDRTRA